MTARDERPGRGTRMPAELERRVSEILARSGLTGSERADVRDELLAHFEDGMAAGRTPEELLASFGDTAASARLIRSVRGEAVSGRVAGRLRLTGLGRDLRIAMRRFRSSPAFVVTAVLSLAIGIGANTAIFTLVNALIVRDPPYASPERLYDVYLTSTDQAYGTFAYPDLVDVREGTKPLVDAVIATQFAIAQTERTGLDDVEMLPIEMVTGDYFPGLGLRAVVGRTLGREDDVAAGAHAVTMLSWRYWQRAYDGDPGVVGTEIELSGRPYTIVGVAPREFSGTLRGLSPELFVPILMQNAITPSDSDFLTERSNHALFVKVRLADGVTPAALESVLATIGEDLRSRGEWSEDGTFVLVPTRDVLVFPPVDRFIRAAAWMLSAVVALVLLIACANLASFLLAKAVDRRREMAVQLSLGATRGTLVRQLMIETVLLGMMAGGVGVLASIGALRWLVNADLPLPLPITLDLSPDAAVLAYSLGISMLAGIAFGLVPAMQATRTQIATVLREETPGGGRRGRVTLRGALVSAQVAVSLILLTTAGLLLRSFRATQDVDPGFGGRPSAIVTLNLRSDRWNEEQGIEFANRLMDRFVAIPGVTGVGLTGRLHLDPLSNWNATIDIEGVEPPPDRDGHLVDWTPVTTGFFDVMGIGVVQGRSFTEADRAGSAPVVVVNEAMARRFWPGGTAVGATIRYVSGRVMTVIGVMTDAKVRSLGEAPRPQFYRPFLQAYSEAFVAVANTTRDPEQVAIEMARAAREADPDVFTYEPKSMARHLATQLLARRLAAWIVGAFAVLALVLASVGLYGLVSYAVSQRRREVGIRMSLGADRAAIMRLLLGGGMRLVVAGVIVGLIAAFALARLLRGLLYGVDTIDPLTFIAVPIVLGTVAFAAAWLPARRAMRVDPGIALRAE